MATQPTKNNPLMNVLLTDIKDNPTREAAQPSFNPEVESKINESAGNVGPDPKLFAEFCYGNMPSCKSGDDVTCLKENPRWINY